MTKGEEGRKVVKVVSDGYVEDVGSEFINCLPLLMNLFLAEGFQQSLQ